MCSCVGQCLKAHGMNSQLRIVGQGSRIRRACTCVACIQAWMALCVDWVLRFTRFQRALGHSSCISTSIASHHMPAAHEAQS